MAGVFKSLDKSDVRITPFRTHKLWSDTIVNNLSGSIYTIYKANYNPISNHPDSNPLRDVFDQGNPYYEYAEPTSSNGKFQRVIHRSIDHLYYRDFLTNNKASFGSGNINRQTRFLEDQALVISMPQSKFGEAILPGSVKVVMESIVSDPSSPGDPIISSYSLVDDSYGNLIVSGTYYGPVGYGVSTIGSGIVTKAVAGEWPLEDLYKYADIEATSFTSSFNKGTWCMESNYNNVSIGYLTSSTYPSSSDMLGAVMTFTSSLSSSIVIKPNISTDYAEKYNFENGDFSISMMVRPTSQPKHPSGSILLSKQGPVEQLRVDENGNIHSQTIPNKSPYRLSLVNQTSYGITPDFFVLFEKDDGSASKFQVSSSVYIIPDRLYHVAVRKSGSIVSLFVSGDTFVSRVNKSITLDEKDCSNLSNIYIGNSYNRDQGFDGVIDNVKIYRQALSDDDITNLYVTQGVGNTYMGNVFYNHGMITLTAIPTRFANITSVESRGTHTIYENEVSCTVNPGDFQMSNNPSLQRYDAIRGDYVFQSYVSSSDFKPYVTTVGLYDDSGNLLVVGKLSQPIQTPNNTDTTFIVRYDK
jgi:hypothetical protein